jgi:hypothetical protein
MQLMYHVPKTIRQGASLSLEQISHSCQLRGNAKQQLLDLPILRRRSGPRLLAKQAGNESAVTRN